MKSVTIFLLLISTPLIFSLSKNAENITIMNLFFSKTSNEYTAVVSDQEDEDAVASIKYNKSLEVTGWDYLYVSSYEKMDNKYDDEVKAYGMGYLEGLVSWERIYPFYLNLLHSNFYDNNNEMTENVKEYLIKNLEYMKTNAINKKDNSEYWEQVYLIYKQMQGLADGYNKVAKNKLSFLDFQLVFSNADVEDAVYYKNITSRPHFKNMTNEEIITYSILHNHCSALIKAANDLSDIWFGHNTWTNYGQLIRIFKEYRFITNKNNLKSKTVAFPSYPGVLNSVDDFYYLDSKLIVMETTNSIYDDTLYDLLKPECLLTWVRTMIANRLSSNGKNWTEIFSLENSGTYNNQFQVLDLSKINLNNKTISDEALYIIEQIPDYTEIKDVSYILRKGYWPSYNIPFLKNIFEKSGYVELINQRPEMYESVDYSGSVRAKMFRRDQSNVKDIESYKKILRYNDYQNDEISKGNAAWALASRYDLNDNIVAKQYCFGAIDVKFISVKEIMEGKNIIHIISSPTNDQQPSFNWTNATCKYNNTDRWYHEGVLDSWDFPWIDYEVKLFKN